jgi:hypothetical protein
MRNSTTCFTVWHDLVCQQGGSEVVGAAAAWGFSSRTCSIQQTRRPYVQDWLSRHAIE